MSDSNPAIDPTPVPAPEDLSVNALLVCCQCTDGKIRIVQFDKGGKQARQVHGYVRHILGGKLTLHKEPVVIVQLDQAPPAPPAPAAAPVPAKRTWIPPFLIRLFRRSHQQEAAC